MATSLTCTFSVGSLATICASFPKPAAPPGVFVQPISSKGCFPLASHAVQASPLTAHEVDSLPTVFADESKGIVCYRSDSGEVICEGPDEGPHFDPLSREAIPLPRQLNSEIGSSSIYLPDMQMSGVLPIFGQDFQDICIKEGMGGIFCEGRDES